MFSPWRPRISLKPTFEWDFQLQPGSLHIFISLEWPFVYSESFSAYWPGAGRYGRLFSSAGVDCRFVTLADLLAGYQGFKVRGEVGVSLVPSGMVFLFGADDSEVSSGPQYRTHVLSPALRWDQKVPPSGEEWRLAHGDPVPRDFLFRSSRQEAAVLVARPRVFEANELSVLNHGNG